MTTFGKRQTRVHPWLTWKGVSSVLALATLLACQSKAGSDAEEVASATAGEDPGVSSETPRLRPDAGSHLGQGGADAGAGPALFADDPRGGVNARRGEPSAIVFLTRFGAGEELYFWSDLVLEVTRVDDPSTSFTVSTVGKPPGFVPFVQVEPGVGYELLASGGRVERWDGEAFESADFEQPEIERAFSLANGGVLSVATPIAEADLVLTDTWATEIDGGDRWYCELSELGCSCGVTAGGPHSWDVCPPINYLCCWQSNDGRACECKAQSGVSCEQEVATAGGNVVDACPASNAL